MSGWVGRGLRRRRREPVGAHLRRADFRRAMRTRVKICCIQSLTEANIAIHLGADCLGLVADMPSGPGTISDAEISEIAARLPPSIASFLLTSRTEPGAVVDHVRNTRPSAVQLVDLVPDTTYAALRRHCPWVRVVQVVHVEDETAVQQAEALAAKVDALLLDSGRPTAPVRELGGTGRTHDWTLSRHIIEKVPIPVFLAGGLGPSNVSEAIRKVKPHGVDLCSGVRDEGALDVLKLRSFMHAVRGTDSESPTRTPSVRSSKPLIVVHGRPNSRPPAPTPGRARA